jgi:hypothetical protein
MGSSAHSRISQIPPDLVVKSQTIDIVDVIREQSGDQTSFNCRVETGNQDLSCHHHLRVIGLPLNAMECENFNLLEKRQTVAMSTFLIWFSANNPGLMRANKENDFSRQVRDIREKCPVLVSEKAFYMICEELKKSAPYLFPINPL